MTTAQKTIKYLALCFAVFLVITIITSILGGIYGLSSFLGLKNNKEIIGEMNTINFNNDVISLDIDVSFTNLVIKTGDTLKVETNNKNINCKQNNQNLKIKEKSYNWFKNKNKGDLILYIPENLEFEEVKINAGAGNINILNLSSKKLDLEFGAGETKIDNLYVTESCDIDTGAGKVSILSGTINNLDLDVGVGETNLTAMINGKSDIDSGIGALNVTLLGEKQDYQIKIDKGIGKINFDGETLNMNRVYGTGESYIEIDGGIGNIKVNFNN